MMSHEQKKLMEISYSRLLKLEVPQLAERVIEIIEEHEPETLKIDGAYNLLTAKQDHIDKLFVWYRSHPLTKELNVLRKVRRLNLRKITFHLRVVIQEDISGVDKSVNLVKSELERFILDFNSGKNEEVKCRMLTQFFSLIETSEELEEAFSTLNFTSFLNDLRSTHSRIMALIENKMTTISYRPIEKTPYLKKSVLNSIKYMFMEIELAILKYPEINFQPLCNKLNVVLNYYANLINLRQLSNKRKAEEGDGVETGETNGIETPENNEPEMKTTSIEIPNSATRLLSMDVEKKNGNGNGNGNAVNNNTVDNEKAAATPSKTLQLPDVNKDESK